MNKKCIFTNQFFGKYKVGNSIGAGGNGFVCEIKYHPGKVIKIFKAPSGAWERKKRFISEINYLKKHKDPLMSPLILDSETDCKNPWFVMERCTTLKDYLQEEQPDLLSRLNICEEILNKLEKLHNENIAHRDIKPSNILIKCINGRNVAVLADFGLISYKGNDPISKVDEGIGSYLYRAPELEKFTEKNHNPLDYFPSDIYSFVKTMWTILANENETFLYGQNMYNESLRTKIEQSANICFEPLYKVIDDGIEFDPTLRPSFKDIRNALHDIKDQLININYKTTKQNLFDGVCRQYKKTNGNTFIKDQYIIKKFVQDISKLGKFYCTSYFQSYQITFSDEIENSYFGCIASPDNKFDLFSKHYKFYIDFITIDEKNSVTLFTVNKAKPFEGGPLLFKSVSMNDIEITEIVKIRFEIFDFIGTPFNLSF